MQLTSTLHAYLFVNSLYLDISNKNTFMGINGLWISYISTRLWIYRKNMLVGSIYHWFRPFHGFIIKYRMWPALCFEVSKIFWKVNGTVERPKELPHCQSKTKSTISSLYLSLTVTATHTKGWPFSLCESRRSSSFTSDEPRAGFKLSSAVAAMLKRTNQMEGKSETWGCFHRFRNGVTCITSVFKNY